MRSSRSASWKQRARRQEKRFLRAKQELLAPPRSDLLMTCCRQKGAQLALHGEREHLQVASELGATRHKRETWGRRVGPPALLPTPPRPEGSCWEMSPPHHVFVRKHFCAGWSTATAPAPPLGPPHLPPSSNQRGKHMAQQGASGSWRWRPGSDWSGPPVKYFKYHSLQLDPSVGGQEAAFRQKVLHLPRPASFFPLAGACRGRAPGNVLPSKCPFLCARRDALVSLRTLDCREIFLCASSFCTPNLFILMQLDKRPRRATHGGNSY